MKIQLPSSGNPHSGETLPVWVADKGGKQGPLVTLSANGSERRSVGLFWYWLLVVLLGTCEGLALAGADEPIQSAKVATPSTGTAKIVSPEPEELLITGSVRAVVRTARDVTRIEATLNGTNVSASFRAVRRGVWTARFPRRLLRPGSNYLMFSAGDALGGRNTDLTRFFLGTRSQDFLSIKAGKPRLGSVPVYVQTVSDLNLLLKATLNGRDITKVFQPRIGSDRTARLGVDEGLRQGRNVLRVITARRDGTFAHRKQVIEIDETQPLVGAGPMMRTTGGLPVQLKGSYLPGSTGGARPRFRWEVISAPKGSAASPERPTRRGTLFKPDQVGTYKLRLSVGAAYDETEIQNVYNAPPIGVPVDMQVISGGDVGIQVGPSYFPLDDANNNIQVVVLDPNTLETLYQGAFPGTAGDAQTVLNQFGQLQGANDIGGAAAGAARTVLNTASNAPILPLCSQSNTYPLVLLSAPHIQNGGANAAWSQVIQAIGGQPLPGMQLENGGFSVIGILCGAAGTAWENPGSNFGNPPPGDIQGYLQQDNQTRFTFVPNRVPYNLTASGAPANQNTIQVGSNSWTSNNTSCGTGAFQVVTLGAENLSPATWQDTAPVNQTFVTNGCGPSADTAGVNAMIQYLNAVTQITGNGNLLVLIQSIGSTPLDPSMSPATLQQLNAAIVGVGGTDSVMGNGSYSLVGRALLPFADLPNGFELAEASSALTGKAAQLSGILKFSRVGVFQPQLSNGSGVPSAALSALAYQAPQPDLNTPGELAALAYIANKVLGLPQPSQASCYIPANNQPDVRSEYCNPELYNSWAIFRTTLQNKSTFPVGQSFTPQDWNKVVNRLAPPSSSGSDYSDYQGEFQAVQSLWSLVSSIQSTNNTFATPIRQQASNISAQIQQSFQPPSSSKALGTWIAFASDIIKAAAPFTGGASLAAGLAGNLLALAGETTNFLNGSPQLGHFELSALDFLLDLSDKWADATLEIGHIAEIIMTDPVKLQTFAQNPNYNLSHYNDLTLAQLGIAQFSWKSLLPMAYQAVHLVRDGINLGIQDARDFQCNYDVNRFTVNYYAFPDVPASAQLLNSRLYVLVQMGAELPDGTGPVKPGTPPASLIDPLFQTYYPSTQDTQVITQFNLYKPWFYREAFQIPNVAQSIGDCG